MARIISTESEETGNKLIGLYHYTAPKADITLKLTCGVALFHKKTQRTNEISTRTRPSDLPN
jgi:hypothetical protein